MATVPQLLAEKRRLEGLLSFDQNALPGLRRGLAAAEARGSSQAILSGFREQIRNTERRIQSLGNLIANVDRQLAATNNPATSNPPDPEVPTAPAPAPRPAPPAAPANNPPNPQVPAATNSTVPVSQVARQAEPVTDTGGVPTQSLATLFEDPGFVPLNQIETRPQDVQDTGGVPTQSLATLFEDPGFVPLNQIETRPQDVQDTGGVPTQSLATLFEDVGFVPQQSAAGDPQAGGFVFGPDGELLPADSAEAQAIVAQQQQVQNATPAPVDDTFLALPDGTGTYGVWSNGEGRFVVQGISEQEAVLRAEEFNTVGFDAPEAQVNAATRQSDFEIAAANEAAIRERARVQATLGNQLRQADSGDWRFRIRLAPGARYLYRGENGQGLQSGILAPLAVTDGVIFPYTPQITTAYRARYAEQDLPHSNYRGYFYSGSNPEVVNVQATFTAQDTSEANYLLAVIHFFRSVTKMFYGQSDTNRGAPPPLVFLQGFGAYQFSRHPCVVTNFNYVLPSDVDYVRADVQPITGLNIQQQRRPGGVPPQSLPTNVFDGALGRLFNAGIPKGGIYRAPPADTLGTVAPTYVPTKMDMTIELLPMQTRQQVSQQFSLKDFASGSLQRKGFW